MDYRGLLGLEPRVSGREQPSFYRDVEGEFDDMQQGLLGMLPMGGMTKLPRLKRYFGDTTGMPMYDEILKNWKWGKEYWKKPHKNKDISLRHMTPDEYMEASFKTRESYKRIQSKSSDPLIKKLQMKEGLSNEYKRIDQKRVDKFADKMKSGIKYDIPVIDLSKFGKGQEGSHRVMAAKKLGEKTIPVIWVETFKKTPKSGLLD